MFSYDYFTHLGGFEAAEVPKDPHLVKTFYLQNPLNKDHMAEIAMTECGVYFLRNQVSPDKDDHEYSWVASMQPARSEYSAKFEPFCEEIPAEYFEELPRTVRKLKWVEISTG